MNNLNLKLFYETERLEIVKEVIVTCEEGREHGITRKKSNTHISQISNNKGFQSILKLTAITLFVLMIEPLYENL